MISKVVAGPNKLSIKDELARLKAKHKIEEQAKHVKNVLRLGRSKMR